MLDQDVSHDVIASFGPFRLSVSERLLARGGEPVAIGGRALDILIVLVEHAGEVLSSKELLKRVWPDVIVEEGSLRVHLSIFARLWVTGKMATDTSPMWPDGATVS